MNDKPYPDYSKLSPELQEKIAQWNSNKPENKQLTVISDIADMLQNFLESHDSEEENDKKFRREIGSLLVDMRESLKVISSKEDKEAPDYSKPIITAIDKLSKVIDEKDYKPTINVSSPKVEVPTPVANVTVDAPKVDTKPLESIIKNELSTAFKEAVLLIPQVDIPEAPDRWDEVIEWLKNIDTASRLKPQFPNSISVTNPDGSSIGSLSGSNIYITVIREKSTDPDVSYIGKALPGTLTSDAAWQIASLDENTNLDMLYADGGAFTQVYDNRESLTYE
jgi:hypothetical protein